MESDLLTMRVKVLAPRPQIHLKVHVSREGMSFERVEETSGGLRGRIYDFQSRKWVRFSVRFSDATKVRLTPKSWGYNHLYVFWGRGLGKSYVVFAIEDDDYEKLKGVLLSISGLAGKLEVH